MVLTEEYHKARGYCCGNGCRHCPYAYENVPEPRRSMLINERNKGNKESQTHYIEPNS